MERVMLVMDIEVDLEHLEQVLRSLEHWKLTATGAYGAKIRLEGVGKQGGN